MLVWILRGAFGVLLLGLAMVVLDHYSKAGQIGWGIVGVLAILATGALAVAGDLVVKVKQITTISAVYFGLLLGLLFGWILAKALDPYLSYWVSPDPVRGQIIAGVINMVIVLVCCYVSVSLLLQTKDEFRFIIPYVEFSKQVKGAKPMVLDTSVIIDGRIADICESRIIDTRLIVPRFVLQELQGIADSSDKLKRNRGRRGLDVLKRLQNNGKVELQMHDGNLPELREVMRVDERLVVFAKTIGARVMTNDFNLNKIAQLQGVDVINLNEVSNALKTVALPGESMTVKLVKPGDQVGQGVGYLEDGTMVVVEQGRAQVGNDVLITVTSVLQTPAGRMIFGRLSSGTGGSSAEMPKLVTPS